VFRLFSRKIAVTFIDAITRQPIASSDMLPEQLPETFALDTTLDLAGTSYVVVRADPTTKVEFALTKRLTVALRRVEVFAPKDILFSLPTICGAALPHTVATASHGDAVVLHEDDFRQCEFVASRYHQEISDELADIQRIHREQAASVGFRKLHLRERIPHPLRAGTPWSSIHALLGDVSPVSEISISRPEHVVESAIGVRFPDGVVLWGALENGSLTALCVEELDSRSETTTAALKRVADELSCALVHWCRCQVYCRDMTIDNAACRLL
jgi:hypothetical protein